MMVPCESCGREIEDEDAILVKIDEEVHTYCSEECADAEESVEVDGEEDDRTT